MSGGITATLVAVGVDAATAAAIAGTAITGAEIGGGLGFGTNLIEGKGFGKSLIGGLEGAGIGGVGGGLTSGLGGALGSEIGSQTIGQGLVGAGVGAGASALQGGNPLLGAGIGGAGGAINANLGSSTPTPSGATATTGAPQTGSLSGAPTAPAGIDIPTSDVTNLPSTPVPGAAQSPITQALNGANSVAGTDLSLAPSSAISTPTSALAGTASTTGFTESNTSGLVSPSTASPSTGGGFLKNLIGGSSSGTALPTPDVAGAGVAAEAPNSIGQALSTGSGSDILTALGKNSNILIPGAGLAFNAIQGNQQPKGYDQLVNTAGNLATQSQQLQSYLASGTLPPGLQQSLDQATKSAKASIRSQYASRGMSGSSAEAQDLANVDAQMQAQGASLAMNLLQQGVNESQLSSQIYDNIMKTQMSEDQNIGAAVTNFATAAAGGNPTTNLKITTG